MSTAILPLLLIALIVYGLERNHARHRLPHADLSGDAAPEDRDLRRVRADLMAGSGRPAIRRARNGRQLGFLINGKLSSH